MENEKIVQSEMFEQAQVKKCRRCGKILPVTEFHKSLNAKDGLQSWCKECQRENYEENRDKEQIKRNSYKLSEYSAKDLMNELKRRGYTGELQFTNTIKL